MGVNFTQETTLSGKKTLQTITHAKELDYFIRLYYVGVSTAEESVLRIKTGSERAVTTYPNGTFCAALKAVLRI